MTLHTFQIQNGDVAMSAATGRPALLSGRAKLRQDVKCMMANAAAPDNIGAGLDAVIDGAPTDEVTVRAMVSMRIRQASQTMVALADRYQRSERTADDRLSRLRQLIVTRIADSATDFQFQADFLSVSGQSITLSGTLGG